MPTKVFRLHTTGAQVIDWSVSPPISLAAINSIPNPTGLTATQQITSIPSPFARMDLVKSAFQYIADPNQSTTGSTIYHRLVSEALDIAQILFDYPRFSKQGVEIMVWDRAIDMDSLIQGGDSRHNLLGNSLNLFLQQGAVSYNFDLLDRLYIIKYNFKVIGGTSPATLFFSAANLDNIGTVNLSLGNHRAFDPQNFTPLWARASDFQEFIYQYVAYVDGTQNAIFNRHLPEFSAYLRKSLDELQRTNHSLHATIKGVIANANGFANRYEPLAVDGANNQLTILRQPYFHSAGLAPAFIAQTSHFVLQSSLQPTQNPPLVLANAVNTPGLIYFGNVFWNPATSVPYKDNQSVLELRQLPGQGQQYPYLTVSDFLEPYLVSLPYQADAKFSLNQIGDDATSYLLPLTTRFFEFFTTDDLLQKKVVLTAHISVPGEVKISLRLPIKQGFVTLERIYKRPATEQLPLQKPSRTGYQEGEIVDWTLTVLIYPFMRFNVPVAPHYRVMLIDTRTGTVDATLSFHANTNGLQPVVPNRIVQRSDKQHRLDGASTHFSVLTQNFDVIQVNLPFQGETVRATIVPAWPRFTPGTARFRVAVDFGTTNTHIEYKVDSRPEKAFNVTGIDQQLQSLHLNTPESLEQMKQRGLGNLYIPIVNEFIPFRLGGTEPYSFPTRTALNEQKGLNINLPTDALADFTLPFYIERNLTPVNSQNSLNLKWSAISNPDNQVRVKKYIEFLLLLIRNKVLMNGGDLNQTQVNWFYPSSMTGNRLALFSRAWKEAYQLYINANAEPARLSESLAPFYYYQQTQKVAAIARPAVSIDIGGGTTDLVIFENNIPTSLSSFKFAANAIYGDGYNGNPINNGFIRSYESKLADIVKQNGLIDLESLMNDLGNNSADIISFFFSLSDHPDVRNSGIPLSFETMLAEDGNLKMVILLYYVALFYHLAKLMKVQGLPSPQFVVFSGNGSKLTSILDPDPNLKTLSKLTRLLFEEVYEGPCSAIGLKQTSNPKEITCKGGLVADQSMPDIEELNVVLTGAVKQELIKNKSSSRTYEGIQYDTQYRNLVLEEVKNLGPLLTLLNKKLQFADFFAIKPSALQMVVNLLNDNDLLINAYQSGLTERINGLSGATDVAVEETLFFYPLVGILNEAAYQLS